MRVVCTGFSLILVLSLGHAQELKKGTVNFEGFKPEGLERTVYRTTYQVYENRDTMTGRKIGLYVVYAPAVAERAAPDPIFFFTGGPGTGAASGAPGEIEHWHKLLPDRDLIFVDQRGTGKSNGLFCKNYGPENALQTYLVDMYEENATLACREELKQRADLTLYTTPLAMDDINEIRAAMGYDRINLVGASYGGRAVLAFLKRHSRYVRSALPLVPSSPWHTMPAAFARDAQRALDLLVADCAAEADCNQRFPKLAEQLDQVINRMQAAPVTQKVTNLWNGEEEHVLFTEGPFTTALRSMLYSPEGAALVPVMIETAAAGDFSPFILYSGLYNRMIGEWLARGLYLSITCAEDIPYFDADHYRRDSRGTFLGSYRIDRQVGACEIWPRGTVSRAYRGPIGTDIPALVISGELDPVCPPRLSEEIAATMSNARHIEIPNMAHGGQNANECLDQLITQFLASGSHQNLDTACVAAVKRPPFTSDIDEVWQLIRQRYGVDEEKAEE